MESKDDDDQSTCRVTVAAVYKGRANNKEHNKLQDWQYVFTLHIPLGAPHTYDFVVVTSLTHPRNILLVVLQPINPQIMWPPQSGRGTSPNGTNQGPPISCA
jgi:hypothetical protein